MKTIYYYQTFVGLDKALTHIEDIDVINVSSIHFDKDKNGTESIYLNDNKPYDNLFNDLWLQTEKASVQGCTILLMVGGAGFAYKELFSDFTTYYPLLRKLLHDKSWIRGIDLDIEERVTIVDVKMLINQLVLDFGEEFIITMAPVQFALQTDEPGMGGFSYKTLYNDIGHFIDYFNGQFYGDYSEDAVKHIGLPKLQGDVGGDAAENAAS